VDYGKVAWALEESIRILEREGRNLDAEFVRLTYLSDAIKRRDKA
jgi:hypothetical protein